MKALRILGTGMLAAILVPLTAWAFGLGEISVESGLGEPFRATIPIQSTAGEEITAGCFSLAPPREDADNAVYLRQAKLSLVGAGKGRKLLIAGTRAINEPYLKVVVQGECSGQGRVTRTYTVLLSATSP